MSPREGRLLGCISEIRLGLIFTIIAVGGMSTSIKWVGEWAGMAKISDILQCIVVLPTVLWTRQLSNAMSDTHVGKNLFRIIGTPYLNINKQNILYGFMTFTRIQLPNKLKLYFALSVLYKELLTVSENCIISGNDTWNLSFQLHIQQFALIAMHSPWL